MNKPTHLRPDAKAPHVASGGEGKQVKPVHASGLNTGEVAEGAVDALGLLVDHERTAAHHVPAVPHLALSGADFLGVLDLKGHDK